MEAPLITIYYRLLSNIDESPVSSFVQLNNFHDLNYGNINAVDGGESPFIIEFDIWNNEPAFSAGMRPNRVKDALNCKLEVWNDKNFKSSSNLRYGDTNEQSFMYARCVTNSKKTSFQPIAGPLALPSNKIEGNVNPTNKGVLSGQPGGDRTIIQTKIIIPPNTNTDVTSNFVFNFEYDFE